MTRADRRTLVRQLAAEGLSQRKIAARLKIGKDTVRRDLEAIERENEPEGAPPGADAPQVSGGDEPESAPQDAPPAASGCAAAPDGAAPDAPLAQLPRQVAQPDELVIDLRRRPGMRRDLAALASAGVGREDLIGQAVYALAIAYQQAVSAGHVAPGPFAIRSLTVGPLLPAEFGPRRPRPPAPAEGA